MVRTISRSLLRLPLVAICLIALLCSAASGWRTVDLPARPLDVAAVADSLWVSGAKELIAKSDDGGKTWQVKHINPNGNALLAVMSPDGKTVSAGSTDGSILLSTDAGNSWKTIAAGSEPIYQAEFADGLHGVMDTDSVARYTPDGGSTWNDISMPKTDDELESFKYILDLAVIDSDHMALLAKSGAAQFYDQRFIVTADGGKTWKPVEVPSTVIIGLSARDGEYWAMGHEVIEKDKPGGGYGVALTMHSADGITWKHAPRAQAEFSSCRLGGCLFWNGAGIYPFGESPTYWRYAPDVPVTSKWASTKGGICTISSVLLCTAVETASGLPKGKFGDPIPATLAPDPAHRKVGDLVCISCPFQNAIFNDEKSGQARAEVEVILGGDGVVTDVKIIEAPTPAIGNKIADQVREWIFRPVPGSSAGEIHMQLNMNVMLIKRPN